MIIEMRTYILKPTTLKKFLDIYNDEIRETHVSILGNQIGFFYTEFGELNKVVHLYGYDSHEDRDKRRAILAKNKDFIKRSFQENRHVVTALQTWFSCHTLSSFCTLVFISL